MNRFSSHTLGNRQRKREREKKNVFLKEIKKTNTDYDDEGYCNQSFMKVDKLYGNSINNCNSAKQQNEYKQTKKTTTHICLNTTKKSKKVQFKLVIGTQFQIN